MSSIPEDDRQLRRIVESLEAQIPTQRTAIRLGSLAFDLHTSDATHFAMLEELLRIESVAHDATDRPIPLHLLDCPEPLLREHLDPPTEAVATDPGGGVAAFHRDVASAFVTTAAHATHEPQRLLVVLQSESTDSAHRLHCLMVVLYRVLFHLARLPLHAAAIDLKHLGTFVFIGDKGAGKSTLSFSLGSGGATVLGEDHVMLKRCVDPNGTPRFEVSGCDGRTRMTEASERHFFPQGLSLPSIEVAGVPKKEFELAAHVPSRPYVDHPVRALCFPRVTAGPLRLESMPAATVLLRLLESSRERMRFSGTRDRQQLLDYLGDFAALPAFSLDLTPDLDDLEQLPELLRRRLS